MKVAPLRLLATGVPGEDPVEVYSWLKTLSNLKDMDRKKHVRCVEDFLSLWAGTGDDPISMGITGPISRSAFIAKAQKDLGEALSRLTAAQRADLLEALAWFEALKDPEIESFWYGNMMPFELPKQRTIVFTWLLEAFFTDPGLHISGSTIPSL